MNAEKADIDIINIMIIERKSRTIEIEKSIKKIEKIVNEDFYQGYTKVSPNIEEKNKEINIINVRIDVLRKEERDLNAEISNLEIMGSM